MVAGDGKQLHVVFLPFYAPSHIIPCVHTARLFASRGVQATIITTEHNALIFKSSVINDAVSGNPISVQTLKFPSSEVGLPAGIENFNAITSPEMTGKIYHGMMLLQTPTQQLIRELSPDCIFSDMFFPWTVDLANELKIPRLLFYPSSFLYHSVFHSLSLHSPQDKVKSENESFVVPDLPSKIEMKRSQLQEHLKIKTGYGELIDRIKQSEMKSYGLVHNTFYELEPDYAEHFKKIKGVKVWHIGPLFQYWNGENDGVLPEKHSSLSWLDSKKPNSVLFVCFGSMVNFPEAQLTEIALSLEECDQPFVWAVRKRENDEERESWLPEGFEERISEKDRGIIVRGWAPQVKILEHPAVGGFMTHCGWNSVLEAAVTGVPLVTWPLYAEHFYNEKLVELLRVGVRVGAEVWNPSFDITSPVVGKDSIRQAVCRLMCDSEEAEDIRRTVKELAEKAKKAVQPGGSSHDELTALIEEIKGFSFVEE